MRNTDPYIGDKRNMNDRRSPCCTLSEEEERGLLGIRALELDKTTFKKDIRHVKMNIVFFDNKKSQAV